MTLLVSRRQLLVDLGILTGTLLPLAGCSSLLTNASFTDKLINDRPTRELRPLFQALIATILPMDHAVFAKYPLSYYEDLIVREFSIYRDEDFTFYRRLLTIFNEPRLFVFYPHFLTHESSSAVSTVQLDEERRHFKRWQKEVPDFPTFLQLPSSARSDYLLLWSQSPLHYKRAFYRVSKLLIYASVFSQEHVYAAIGYAGPLLKEGDS